MNKRMAELQTNEWQVQETLSMEELSKKIQDATKELNQLKQGLNNLSLEEQNSRLAEIESSIFDCSESLEELENDNAITVNQEQLNVLKSKVNVLKSEKESLKQQIEIQVRTEMEALTKSVNTTPASEQNQENNEENSNWWEKKWLWRQREWLTTRQWWKEHPWRNILWTLWWVWIVAWVCSLFKSHDYESEIPWYSEMSRKEKRLARRKLRKEKRAERRENRPWRQKFLIWAWIATWTVVWWVEVYKHWNKISAWFQEKLWLALSFEEARQKVENEVRNWKVDDDHFGAFNANFDSGITYNEETQEICSYEQKTKIDKKTKKLEWLDVEFASYEELIHAANIVNFAKRKLRWRWASSAPFKQTDRWWDIAFACSGTWEAEFLSANNSNERSWILGTVGTVWWWILGWYCAWVKWVAIWSLSWWLGWYVLWAYIDNTSAAGRCCQTIARWKNFDLFLNYLNRQTDENGKSLWESVWDEHIDPNWTPINNLIDNWYEGIDYSKREWVLAEIEKTYWYWESHSWRRNLEIIRDKSKPNDYIIKSFGHNAKLTIEWWPDAIWGEIDYSKIKKIHIEKYEDNDWWDWLDIDFPKTEEWVKEAIKTANLTNMIREDRNRKWWEEFPFMYGMYVRWLTDWSFNLDIDTPGIWSNYQWWTCVVSHDMLKNRFPTIFEDMDKTRALFVKGIPSVEYRHDQAREDKSEWSQYIKFLHQMRAKNWGQYRKKV